MSNICFTIKAWEEYCYWQTQDKKTLKRINLLLADIQRNVFTRTRKARASKRQFKRLLEQKD